MLKTQLTAEQSAKLIELGVSPERASEIYIDAGEHDKFSISKATSMMLECAHEAKVITPIFTLSDLVSLLPKKITFGHRTNCRLKLQPIISSKDRISEVWQACYLHTSLKANAEAPELIDALYSLLVWCLEKGYVKVD